jgi:CRISPR-associated endonuclease Cas2
MKYLFCYDIASPKRLQKISKGLNEKGFRVQYSFFCCDLSKEEAQDLFSSLEMMLGKKEDKLAMFAICEKCYSKIKNYGRDELLVFHDYMIL